MIGVNKYLVLEENSIKDALMRLNTFTMNDGLTLFVLNKDGQLCGTLTDGDIRRALIDNQDIGVKLGSIMNTTYKYIKRNQFTTGDIQNIKLKGVNLLPLIDDEGRIIKIINLSKTKSVIPVDVVIMAGGKGERLLPLTKTTPKPLLIVGDKPIIEHNIDRLSLFGMDNIYITLRYLGDQIRSYFSDGASKNIIIKYVEEKDPLGTVGAVGLIDDFTHDNVLIMNSDLLTNINWEIFYSEFCQSEADMMVATIPYEVQVPYAVLETNDMNEIQSFKEKPTYTYFSNAGIYLVKKKNLDIIPENVMYNATDLIEDLIANGKKVVTYSILDYWLDIGRQDDFKKANEDIKHLKL